MQVLGVGHSVEYELFPQIVRYLSRLNLRGKIVAIESIYSIEKIRTFNDLAPDGQFVLKIAELVERAGGKVVTVENERLHDRQTQMRKKSGELISQFDAETDPTRKHKIGSAAIRSYYSEGKISFRRTLRLVDDAQKKKADLLITGASHAHDIKQVMGRKSDVRIIATKSDIMKLKPVIPQFQFLKTKRKRYSPFLKSVVRKGKPLKRPRLREKLRQRRH